MHTVLASCSTVVLDATTELRVKLLAWEEVGQQRHNQHVCRLLLDVRLEFFARCGRDVAFSFCNCQMNLVDWSKSWQTCCVLVIIVRQLTQHGLIPLPARPLPRAVSVTDNELSGAVGK